MHAREVEAAAQRAKACRTEHASSPSSTNLLRAPPSPYGVFPMDIWRLIFQLLSYAKLRSLTCLNKPLLSLLRPRIQYLCKRVPVEGYADHLRRNGAVRPTKEIPLRGYSSLEVVLDLLFTPSGNIVFLLGSSGPRRFVAQLRRASDCAVVSEVELVTSADVGKASVLWTTAQGATNSRGDIFLCLPLVSVVEMFAPVGLLRGHDLREEPVRCFADVLGKERVYTISVAMDDALLVALCECILALDTQSGTVLRRFSKPDRARYWDLGAVKKREAVFHGPMSRLQYFSYVRVKFWNYQTGEREGSAKRIKRIPDDVDATGHYLVGQESGVHIWQEDGVDMRLLDMKFPLAREEDAEVVEGEEDDSSDDEYYDDDEDDDDEDDEEECDDDIYEPNEGSKIVLKVRNDGAIFVFRCRLSPTDGRMKYARITVYSIP